MVDVCDTSLFVCSFPPIYHHKLIRTKTLLVNLWFSNWKYSTNLMFSSWPIKHKISSSSLTQVHRFKYSPLTALYKLRSTENPILWACWLSLGINSGLQTLKSLVKFSPVPISLQNCRQRRACLLRAVFNVQNCHHRYFRTCSDWTGKHLMSLSHLKLCGR